MTQFAVAILNSFGTNDDMALITLPEAEKKLVSLMLTINFSIFYLNQTNI